jgi:hypothetical protein
MALERVEQQRNQALDNHLNELFESYKIIVDSALVRFKCSK